MENRERKPRSIQVGLSAGSVSAVVASLASLPLVSPHDGLFNTATVTLGSLAAGVLSGVTHRITEGKDERVRVVLLAAVLLATFAVAVVVSVVMEMTALQRSISFIVPLAAISLTLTGLLTLQFSRMILFNGWVITAIVLVVALALGASLSIFGDMRPTELELPPRASSSLCTLCILM